MLRYHLELCDIEAIWSDVISKPLLTSDPDGIDLTKPIIAVGSGCSLTVAAFAATVFRSRGATTAFCTPFDLPKYILQESTVLIVTAGAAHPDVLSSITAAVEGGAKPVLVTLNRAGSLLADAERLSSHMITVESEVRSTCFIPPGLPTALMALILKLAFRNTELRPYGTAPKVARETHEAEKDQLQEFRNVSYIHIIRDSFSLCAAIDLETRLLETGMYGVSISDPWNFGHGRYTSLATPGQSVGVVLIGSSASQDLDRISVMLPESIPQCRVSVPGDGLLVEVVACFRAMWLVDTLATLRNIDPCAVGSTSWGDTLYMDRKTAWRTA